MQQRPYSSFDQARSQTIDLAMFYWVGQVLVVTSIMSASGYATRLINGLRGFKSHRDIQSNYRRNPTLLCLYIVVFRTN